MTWVFLCAAHQGGESDVFGTDDVTPGQILKTEEEIDWRTFLKGGVK